MNFSNLKVQPICDPYDLSRVIEYLRVNLNPQIDGHIRYSIIFSYE